VGVRLRDLASQDDRYASLASLPCVA
jgi:hypothetical protein